MFKIGIGLTILGMVWVFSVFDEGDKISENFSLKSSESAEIELYFEGKDIGFYKIFIPEFAGEGVFVQILDNNHNVISDGTIETIIFQNRYRIDSIRNNLVICCF